VLTNKHIAVVGAGKSGVSVSALLLKKGAKVFLSEKENEISFKDRIIELQQSGLEYELGGHTDKIFKFSDFFVISPGVDPSIDVIKKAVSQKIPIYSELEVASWFCKSPIIAVTGSNGKTTTTAILGEIFRMSGNKTFVAGNIGNPFSECADKTDENGFVILEVSSFQLEAIKDFKPFISIILNISPDHLDRYTSYKDYIDAKFQILNNMNNSGYLIFYNEDEIIQQRIKEKKINRIPFSLDKKFSTGAYKDKKQLKFFRNGMEEISVDIDEITIKGLHNEQNILASISAARLCGIENQYIYGALKEFKGIEHRMEIAGEIEGVKFINDSKATNIDSVYYALKSLKSPIILIAGGKDKRGNITKINNLLKEKVKLLILLGEAADRMETEWKECTKYIKVNTFEDGVREAWENSVKGDVILLSPACSSFDMFTSYEERGKKFKKIYREIEAEICKKNQP